MALLSLALAGTACHEPTEYSSTSRSGVTKIRVSDNSVIGTAEGISDGRSLASLGNTQFLVASGSGVLYRFDSATMSLDTSFAIGFGSGAGYGEIILPKPGSAYVIGAAGSILEISLQSNSVADELVAGPLPVCMCPSASDQRFYVGDGSDRRIREIDSETNTQLRQSQPLSETPVSLCAESLDESYLFACCSDDAGTVERLSLSSLYSSQVLLGSICADVSAFPAESVWAVAHPDWYGLNGRISICSSFFSPEVQEIALTGHPIGVCSVPGSTLFYVLSYLGDGISRATAVNFLTGDIVDHVDLEGFPWDITSHANGEYVLVLTSEI
ncbi:hypothetical protein JW921_07985 [Candidatus Fermentibacterales bacterium]|nr:hypothetical protein [Candidatus Fermentibacterales bacterium]